MKIINEIKKQLGLTTPKKRVTKPTKAQMKKYGLVQKYRKY
jgi:hypothetical protein